MPPEERFSHEPPPPPRRRTFDADGDATRRTWLASERTMLAWLRTGLTATAVALAVGKVLPDLTDQETTWPYVALGGGYALLGVALILFGLWRTREVEAAIRAGAWVTAGRATWILGGVSAILGLASFAVVLFEG